MTGWYREDLAYIHDAGHADFALDSAPGILEILAQNGIHGGLVVDLGCGSGLWARELVDAGYHVFGIDISEAMIELSRQRVPEAEFRVGSLFEMDIPPCDAVTAVSEVLNYLFDEEGERRGPSDLFRRVYDALSRGGVFVFDVLGPGQVPPGTTAKSFRVGEHYRRTDEVHRVRMYDQSEISAELTRAGFEVRTMRSYGGHLLAEGHAAFVARKPA